MSRLQLVYSLEESLAFHTELEHQVILESLWIGLHAGQKWQQRFHLRGEVEHPVHNRIVKGLNPKVVPGAEQRLPFFVPKGKGEHTGKMLHALLAPHLIGPEDHFRVTGGLVGPAQLLFQFDIVVDLPVEADPVTVVVGHGLLAGCDINDAETAVGKAHILGLPHPDAVTVRAAVGLKFVHYL